MRDWQKEIIRGIYDGKTRRAIITFGRKNGKTALSAFLCLLHLCGPEAKRNSQLYSAAQSREQAGIVFNLAAKMVRMNPDLNAVVRIRDTAKEILCPELGTIYKALSAEASTAYGLSPVFVVHDELGQVRGPRDELYEALETASGAQESPLSIVISTQAPTDADLLSILIEDARTQADGRVKLFQWSAPDDADPFAEETVRQANPAFGDFQNAVETMAMAEDARRMPSRESEYRNLILNQRVETNAPYVSRGVWNANSGPPMEDWSGLPVYAGLDLSENRDLTAFVMGVMHEGIVHVRPLFWLPGDALRERAERDRVPYDVWARDGYLLTTDGRTVEYDFVAEYLAGIWDQYDFRKIAFDRWNFKHFRSSLTRAGFTEFEIEEKFVEFGQGYQSMSPALRELDSILLNGRMRHGGNPVLDMCAANAVVKSDPANNRKLIKLTPEKRIDGMIALAMMVSIMATDQDEGEVTYIPGQMFA